MASTLDPNIPDLEKRLLGEIHGRFGLFTKDSLTNVGDQLDNVVASVGNKNLELVFGNSHAKGMEAVHSQYPNEIEYYACAFELLNSKGETVEFFSFPVMPSSMRYTHSSKSHISKTMGGVTITTNSTFLPFQIAINGNFGRRFRRIMKVEDISSVSKGTSDVSRYSEDGNINSTNTLRGVQITPRDEMFSTDYKTGYGSTKILESIMLKSQRSDIYYGSHKLIFYNLSFNQAHMVEIVSHDYGMTKDLNRIWSYNLAMRAVAPASAIMKKTGVDSSIANLLSFSKKNKEFGDQTLGIKNLLDPTGRENTLVRRTLEKQIRSRANNLIGFKTTNAFNAVKQLVSDPNNADNFLVSASEGLLNRI